MAMGRAGGAPGGQGWEISFTLRPSRASMPVMVPAWDIGVPSIKRSSQNQFNECRYTLFMVRSLLVEVEYWEV